MPKWKATFEVDLGDSIPKQEDLKPHDYPLSDWARQALFDMLFNYALCQALSQICKYCTATEPDDVAMLHHYKRKEAIARQACDTFQLELIEE